MKKKVMRIVALVSGGLKKAVWLVPFLVGSAFGQTTLPNPSGASPWDPSSVTTTVGPYLDVVFTTVLGIIGMLLIFLLVRFGFRQVAKWLGRG